MAIAALGVHTAAMLAVIAAIALLVYEWVGLAFLRRGWINLDLVWTAALAASGAVLLATSEPPRLMTDTGRRGARRPHPGRLRRRLLDRADLRRAPRLRSRRCLPRVRRDRAPPHRPRRAAGRLEDRLHQPHDLGRIRRARPDLGPDVRHDGRAGGPEPRPGALPHRRTGRAPHRAGDRAALRRPAASGHGREGAARLHRRRRARLRDRAVGLSGLALHGGRHGRRLRPARPPAPRPASPRSREDRPGWLAKLADFEIALFRDGVEIDRGIGRERARRAALGAAATSCAAWRIIRSAGRCGRATSSRPARSRAPFRSAPASAGRTRISGLPLAGMDIAFVER